MQLAISWGSKPCLVSPISETLPGHPGGWQLQRKKDEKLGGERKKAINSKIFQTKMKRKSQFRSKQNIVTSHGAKTPSVFHQLKYHY